MTPRASGGKTFARYLLFQLPGNLVAAVVLVLLVRSEILSSTLAWILFGLWVAGELAMYPRMRIAYEPGGGSGGADALVGLRGVAREPLDPQGWVEIGAERWRAVLAEGSPGVGAGDTVCVLEVRDLTLVVELDADAGGVSRQRDG